MGDNKPAVVSKRFEMKCYMYGHETKKQLGHVATTTMTQETAVIVSATPPETLDDRLEKKAREVARSVISTHEWRNCEFKRFLPAAEQVLSSSQTPSAQNIFSPAENNYILRTATWWTTTWNRSMGDAIERRHEQTFAIPFIPNENPLDTARRLLKEVMAKGESTPRLAVKSDLDDITLTFNFSHPEANLIRKAVGLKQQVEANIESEKELQAEEQRRRFFEKQPCPAYPHGNACY